MIKITTLFFLFGILSCVKPTEEEIILESMKGEWWLVSKLENQTETIKVNEDVLITFFDIEKNISRINIKNFDSAKLNFEEEGNVTIENKGTKISIVLDNLNIKTVYEMSFVNGNLNLKTDKSNILYKR